VKAAVLYFGILTAEAVVSHDVAVAVIAALHANMLQDVSPMKESH
jgi:hypothetical protein